MTDLSDRLRDLLEPVRDSHVAALLEALAAELAAGAEVEPEALDRGPDGAPRRHGPLRVPRRVDLRVERDGRALPRRIATGAGIRFEPMTGAIDDRARLRIMPFAWSAAEVRLLRGAGGPNWTPVRRWFLEWSLPRFGEEAPDLNGVVHALEGPMTEPGGWRFTVDLGSASVAGFAAMLDAFAHSGCAEIRVGETEDVA